MRQGIYTSGFRCMFAVLLTAAAVLFSPAILSACGIRPASVTVDAEPAPKAKEHPTPKADPQPGQSPRAAAAADFAQTVRRWGAWLTGTLLMLGVACLVLSFTGLGRTLGIETGEAAVLLALSAAAPVIQYALAAWGTLAADVVAWVTIAATATAAAGAVVLGARWAWRHRNRFGNPKGARA